MIHIRFILIVIYPLMQFTDNDGDKSYINDQFQSSLFINTIANIGTETWVWWAEEFVSFDNEMSQHDARAQKQVALFQEI